ncbi:MAG TPA: M20/M25/M40 family metallo-hydrolase, partial [Pyrinomonadaceae bacterium]|nr:M20/M25/M40 family metallo-hydrolase [Pyrinomonadaceae bacterium]
MTTPARSVTIVEELVATPEVQAAFQSFAAEADRITAEQIAICSIAAPPFGEQERAEYFLSKLAECGLSNSEIDEAGNCLALYEGRTSAPVVVVSAHLDTVFPAGTDLTLRHSNNRLLAPGISDDGCGLAALTAIARALTENSLQVESPILFAATVGEEGEG